VGRIVCDGLLTGDASAPNLDIGLLARHRLAAVSIQRHPDIVVIRGNPAQR